MESIPTEFKLVTLSEGQKKELEEIVLNPPEIFTEDRVEIEERIKAFGPAAALYIIDRIKKTNNQGEIYPLVKVLEATDTASVELEIGSLLEQEKVIRDVDRSNKGRILSILNRSAVMANLPQIKKFGEMSLETKYGSYGTTEFNRMDVIDTIRTLFYLKSSLEKNDLENLKSVDEAIVFLNDLLLSRGHAPLTVFELQNFEEVLNRQELNKPRDNKSRVYDQFTDREMFDDFEDDSELDDPFDFSMSDGSYPDDYEDLKDEQEREEEIKDLERLLDMLRGPVGNYEGKDNYVFFDTELEREELFEYCKKIADHLHDEKIPSLVVIDRSSRPLYIGVKEYWRYKYPNEKPPNIYFINPTGFKNGGQKVVDDFQSIYKKLMEDKDKPVLVFDSCIHSGNTLLPVKKAMTEIGFKELIIGSINPSDEGSAVETDFYITEERPEKGCYPFDRDRIIEKSFYSPHSKRTSDVEQMQRSTKLRREIKRIMEEKIKELNDL